jgi:FMN phosphatase YigB (HAD superfamily)
MLGAIEFAAYADAAPALRELRAAGVRLVAASNWDCSLPSVLGRVGLAPLLDGVVSSAVAGAAKPDERLFRAALEAAGVEPALERDVAGAQAAGMRALLLDRGAGSAGECRGDGDGEPVARSHTAAAVRPEALGGRAIDGDVRVIWTLAQLRSLT